MNFRAKAQEQLSLSDIMRNRDKLDTEQLIGLHPNCVNIDDFDLTNINGEIVAVYSVKEEPKYFLFGGKLLKDLFECYVKEYDGDIEKCREDFRTSGGIQVKLERGKTRENREITKVTVL